MADLVVTYDPNLEVASIVDLDKMIGWGPMYKGPDAQEILEGFIAAAPFDVSILTSEQAKDVFWSMGEIMTKGAAETSGQAGESTVGDNDQPTGSDLASATAEAIQSGTVPPVQPADTDTISTATDQAGAPVTTEAPPTVPMPPAQLPASQVEVGQVMNCGLCNMDGSGSTDPGCVACGGSGKLIKAA